MNSATESPESKRLMTLLDNNHDSVVLASDNFSTVLTDACFFEESASEGFDKKIVGPKPLKALEKTPASHSAFRLVEAARDKVTDREMLEMALCSVIPRRRLSSVTRALLARFGTFAGVVCGSLEDLREVAGLGEGGVAAIKTIQAAAIRLARAEVIDRPILGNWDRVVEYLTIAVSREKSEHLRVLYLDAQNRVIGEELQSEGTLRAVALRTRDLVQRILRMNATAVILVHNHPSGSPKPSPGDIELTEKLNMGLQLISVVLHDHVIIGKEGWFSFRGEGLL